MDVLGNHAALLGDFALEPVDLGNCDREQG
jgi:hypothetical protein